MPKISLNPSMTVRPETIETELKKIDSLLSGKIDVTNLGTYENRTTIKLFPSMFTDFPSDTKDVGGMKFFAFGNESPGDSAPETLFFDRLMTMINNNKVFQTVQGTASFKVTNSSFEQESAYISLSDEIPSIKTRGMDTGVSISDFFKVRNAGPKGSNFKKIIYIPKPPSFIPIVTVGNESNFFAEYSNNILHTFEFDATANTTPSTSKPFDIYIGNIVDGVDHFAITVMVTAPTMEAEEYINVSVTVTILCEEKP